MCPFDRAADGWKPNDSEKALLQQTFSYEFDFQYELGYCIYRYVFERNPRILQLFPYLRDYGANFEASPEFRTQALRFAQVRIYHDNVDCIN
jgi:hypothetical protein